MPGRHHQHKWACARGNISPALPDVKNLFSSVPRNLSLSPSNFSCLLSLPSLQKEKSYYIYHLSEQKQEKEDKKEANEAGHGARHGGMAWLDIGWPGGLGRGGWGGETGKIWGKMPAISLSTKLFAVSSIGWQRVAGWQWQQHKRK